MNHQKTPKFLRGHKQFTEGEVSADKRIFKLRYTCKVAFPRVTKTRGLWDVILSDFFQIVDDMNDARFAYRSRFFKVLTFVVIKRVKTVKYFFVFLAYWQTGRLADRQTHRHIHKPFA